MVEAQFSPCRLYRFSMVQRWSPGRLTLFGMMNPSDAGRRLGERWTTDATVTKVGRISRRLGFDGLIVGNACARIVTQSATLASFEDAVGDGNLEATAVLAGQASMVVIAHGRLPDHLRPHAARMCDVLTAAGHVLHVLRLTPDGVPMHPLARGRAHISEDVVPAVWDRQPAEAEA